MKTKQQVPQSTRGKRTNVERGTFLSQNTGKDRVLTMGVSYRTRTALEAQFVLVFAFFSSLFFLFPTFRPTLVFALKYHRIIVWKSKVFCFKIWEYISLPSTVNIIYRWKTKFSILYKNQLRLALLWNGKRNRTILNSLETQWWMGLFEKVIAPAHAFSNHSDNYSMSHWCSHESYLF